MNQSSVCIIFPSVNAVVWTNVQWNSRVAEPGSLCILKDGLNIYCVNPRDSIPHNSIPVMGKVSEAYFLSIVGEKMLRHSFIKS